MVIVVVQIFTNYFWIFFSVRNWFFHQHRTSIFNPEFSLLSFLEKLSEGTSLWDLSLSMKSFLYWKIFYFPLCKKYFSKIFRTKNSSHAMKTNFDRHLINYWRQIHYYLISFLTFPCSPHFLFLSSSKFLQPVKTFQRPRFFSNSNFEKLKTKKALSDLTCHCYCAGSWSTMPFAPLRLLSRYASHETSQARNQIFNENFSQKTNLTNWVFLFFSFA